MSRKSHRFSHLNEDMRRLQLVRPYLKHLRSPLTRGKEVSSWFREKSEVTGFPIYLIACSTYYNEILLLRQQNLSILSQALNQESPKSLVNWINTTSVLPSIFQLPTIPTRILQVDYLNLFVETKKLDSEERLALASYIKDNIEKINELNRDEIHELFSQEYWAIDSRQIRRKILEEVDISFISQHIYMLMKKLKKDLENAAPSVDKNEILRLWHDCDKNPKLGYQERVLAIHREYFKRILKGRYKDLRNELDAAGDILVEHFVELEEFSEFYRTSRAKVQQILERE